MSIYPTIEPVFWNLNIWLVKRWLCSSLPFCLPYTVLTVPLSPCLSHICKIPRKVTSLLHRISVPLSNYMFTDCCLSSETMLRKHIALYHFVNSFTRNAKVLCCRDFLSVLFREHLQSVCLLIFWHFFIHNRNPTFLTDFLLWIRCFSGTEWHSNENFIDHRRVIRCGQAHVRNCKYSNSTVLELIISVLCENRKISQIAVLRMLIFEVGKR